MDKRTIENIQPFTKGNEIVRQLEPVVFNQKVNGKINIGLVSQSVGEIEPLLVSKNLNGILSVENDRLLMVLVNAVKELQHEVESLKKIKKK